MTTKPKAEKNGVAKTKRAVAAKAKLTTGAKRAVKRVRVQMVKPTPSAPEHVVETERADAPKVDMKEMEALVVPAPSVAPVMIARHDLELMIRREAFKRAQARQFRGGSPAQDWFAAEASVKAELHSKGVQLPN